jgi:2-dehydropantoate 2-reductase
MRILILGAGVVGSFNAARLFEAGQDVTLLARGRRLEELREHGVVLEDIRSGRSTTTKVPLVDRLESEDAYDLAIVPVRRNQIAALLPALAQNHHISSVLFLGNNAAGPREMIEALGRERVLIGMPNVAGARQDHVVRYLWWRRIQLIFGEVDGVITPRTEAIARIFRSAGLHARVVKNIDAWQKTHAAGMPAMAGAIYMAGGEVRRLARRPDVLRLYLQAFREALRALRAVGIPLRPFATRLMEWMPAPILLFGMRRFCNSRLAVMAGLDQVMNAYVDEMKELADELRAILRQSGLPSPANDALFAQVDARFQASQSASAPH